MKLTVVTSSESPWRRVRDRNWLYLDEVIPSDWSEAQGVEGPAFGLHHKGSGCPIHAMSLHFVAWVGKPKTSVVFVFSTKKLRAES
jgi:hypothetical protein